MIVFSSRNLSGVGILLWVDINRQIQGMLLTKIMRKSVKIITIIYSDTHQKSPFWFLNSFSQRFQHALRRGFCDLPARSSDKVSLHQSAAAFFKIGQLL